MAVRALEKAGLDFSLINSGDIKRGALADYRLLYVPGGWAKNKLLALGAEGAEMIRRFVEGGGTYAGVCGGAGLATSDGLGLLNVKRRPLEQRVPSLSVKIMAVIRPHPVWAGIRGRRPGFHVWWPSQLEPAGPSIKVLAGFYGATAGTFSSDLSVADFSPPDLAGLEAIYKLNLDPVRMQGSPLVMEGCFGAGRVFITLLHFDTPGDRNGRRVLRNLWEYAGCGKAPRTRNAGREGRKVLVSGESRKKPVRAGASRAGAFGELAAPMEELYLFGLRNFLWFPRGWVVQWRRGVRGLEYFTLREMTRELAFLSPGAKAKTHAGTAEAEDLAHELRRFAEKAKTLLMLERLALQEGRPLTFSNASSGEMAALRAELFSGSKSHGGAFKEILDRVDALLYERLKA